MSESESEFRGNLSWLDDGRGKTEVDKIFSHSGTVRFDIT